MASIDRLNQGDIAAADSIPFGSATQGADRRTSVSQLAAVLQSLMTARGSAQQYSSPNATGFSVTVSPVSEGGWVWLLLTPTAGFAAGTLVLPYGAHDRQEVTVTCTQAVTTLTVNGNGAAVNGSPSTLAANGFFRLKYDAVNASWYRIG